MKVEKFLKFLFLVVCATTMVLNFTACSEEEDGVSTIITYIAKGSISASSSDAIDSAFAIADYTEAITDELGSYYFNTEKDNEV